MDGQDSQFSWHPSFVLSRPIPYCCSARVGPTTTATFYASGACARRRNTSAAKEYGYLRVRKSCGFFLAAIAASVSRASGWVSGSGSDDDYVPTTNLPVYEIFSQREIFDEAGGTLGIETSNPLLPSQTSNFIGRIEGRRVGYHHHPVHALQTSLELFSARPKTFQNEAIPPMAGAVTKLNQ
jgi:hypothetical protein